MRKTSGTPTLTSSLSPRPGDIVFWLSPAGKIIFWSPEAESRLGFAPEEVTGLGYEELLRPSSQAHAQFDLARVMAGRDFAGGFDCRRKDGTSAALYLYATAGRDRHGTPAGVVVVGREVTGVWRAEEAARSSERRFTAFFEGIADAIIVTDRSGQIVEANAATARLAGRPREQLPGIRIIDLVPPDRRVATEAVLFELAHKGRMRSQLTIRLPGGGFRDIEFSAARVLYDNRRLFLAVCYDATERNRAAQEREASAQKYRRMFEAAPDAVFLETLDGRILEANDSACRMLGYTRTELLALRLADLMPPEAVAWLPKISEALIKHGVFSAEGENRHKDGHLVPVEVICSLVDLPGGPAVLAMVRDITERKQAQQALAESEARLRTLQDNVPVGLFRTTAAGKFESVNPAFVRMFGYGSAEEMQSVPVAAVYADPAERKALLERLVRTERLEDVEVLARRKDGTTFVALMNVRAGRAGVFDGAIQDITERKRAQERYRLLFESTTDSVAIADIDGRVVDANPACLRIYGYTAEEVRGMNVADVVAPESRDDAGRAMAVLAQGGVASGTLEMLRKDGTRLTADLLAFVSLVGGERRIFSFTRDITARRAAERQLGESEERFRRLVSGSPDGIAVYQDQRVVIANQSCAAMLGYDSADRLIGKLTTELVHPEDLPAIAEREQTLVQQPAGHAERPLRVRFRRQDGGWVPAEVVGAMTTWQGRPAIQVMVRDISERERAGRALAESEEHYRTALDSMIAAAHVVDRDLKLVVVNRAYRDWYVRLGLTPVEPGQHLAHVAPFLGEKVWDEYRQVFDSGESLVTQEQTVIGGQTYYTETRKSPVVEGGKVVRVLTVIYDVTARVVAERQERVLAETAAGFVQLGPEQDLFGYIADQLEKLFPGVIFSLNSYDEPSRTIRVNRLGGLGGELAARVRAVLSAPLEGMELPGVPAEVVGDLASGVMTTVPGGLYGALFRWLPEDTCRRLESELGIAGVYSLGLRRDDRLYGNFTLLLRAGQEVAASIAEVFAGQASIAIERRLAEREVVEQRRRLATTIANLPGMAYRCRSDENWTMEYSSEGAFDLTGRTAAELVEHGNAYSGLIHPADRGWSDEEIRAALADHEPFVMTYRLALPGGEKWVWEQGRGVYDADGNCVAFEGFITDISELKQAEQAVAESEANYRALLASMNEGVATVDMEGRVTYVNDVIVERSGRPRDWWLGRCHLEAVPDNYRPVASRALDAALRGEPVVPYEVGYTGNAGQAVWIEAHIAPIWRDGRIVGGVAVNLNITERKRAELARAASEEKYRALAEAAPVAVGMTDTGGRWVYVSPRMVALHGYSSAEELLGRPAFELVAPEDRVSIEQTVIAALQATGLASGLAARGLRRDGTTFDAELSTAVLRGPDGAPVGAIDVVLDVTERNRAQRGLGESEAKYRSVVERASDGICIIQNGRIRFINHRLAEMAGYAPEELDGALFLDHIRPDDRQMVADRYRRRLAGEELPSTYTIRINRRDGTAMAVELNAAVMSYGGAPADIVLVRDVTERRQAEERLRQSEERFRLLFEQSPDAIGVHQDGRVVMVNPECVHLLGYESADELVGRPMMDLVHPDDRQVVARRVQQALDEGRLAAPADERFLKKDGSFVWVEVASAPYVWQGRPALQARVRDITARRQAQQRAQGYLDVASVILVALDAAGRVTLINRRGAEILGRTEAELSGADWFATCVPERMSKEVRTGFDRLMAGDIEHVEYYDNPVLNAAGKERLIAWHNALLRDDAGNIVGTLSSGQDVTEQRAAEARLAASEALYRRLVETSPDGLAVHQAGKIVAVNPSGARALGYDRPEELIGTEIMAIVHPDDRQRVAERVRAAMAEGRTGELVEERFRHKDGSYVWVEVANAPFTWQGQPAVQVRVRDISERKWLQGKFEELTAHLDAIFHHVPYGLAAEYDGRIAYANGRFARLFGYDAPGDLYGLPVEQLFAPDDRARVAGYTAARLAGKEAPRQYRFRGLRRDGTVIEVENTVTTYTVGSRTYILGSVRPVEDGGQPDSPRA